MTLGYGSDSSPVRSIEVIGAATMSKAANARDVKMKIKGKLLSSVPAAGDAMRIHKNTKMNDENAIDDPFPTPSKGTSGTFSTPALVASPAT